MVTRWMVTFLSAALSGAVSTVHISEFKPDFEGAALHEHQQNESINPMELYKTSPFGSYTIEKLKFEKDEREAKKRLAHERQMRYARAQARLTKTYQKAEEEKKKKQALDDKMRKQILRHAKAAVQNKKAAIQLRTKQQVHKAGTKEIHRKNMALKDATAKYEQTLKITSSADHRLKELRTATNADKQAIARQSVRAKNLELATQYAREMRRQHGEAERAYRAAQADFYGFPTAPPAKPSILQPKSSIRSLPKLPLPKLPPLSKIRTATKIVNAAGPLIADAAENIADLVEERIADSS